MADTHRAGIDRAGLTVIALVEIPGADTVVATVVERTEVAIGARGVTGGIDGDTLSGLRFAGIQSAGVRVDIA